MLSEGQMNVFPLILAVSGLARSLAETGSCIKKRFLAGRSARLEQLD